MANGPGLHDTSPRVRSRIQYLEVIAKSFVWGQELLPSNQALRCDLQISNGQWAWLAWRLSKGTVANSIFGGHSEELRKWGQKDEGGLSILIRALLTYHKSTRPGSGCSGHPRLKSMRRCCRHAFAPKPRSSLWPPNIEWPIEPGSLCAATPDLRSAKRGRGVGAWSSFARNRMWGQVEARHLWPRTLQLHQQYAEKHRSNQSQSQNAASPVGCYVMLCFTPSLWAWCFNAGCTGWYIQTGKLLRKFPEVLCSSLLRSAMWIIGFTPPSPNPTSIFTRSFVAILDSILSGCRTQQVTVSVLLGNLVPQAMCTALRPFP